MIEFTITDSLAARKACVDHDAGMRLEREVARLRSMNVVESAPGNWNGDHVVKSAEPDLVKVGPEGYVHGWKYVGTGADLVSPTARDHVTSARAAESTGDHAGALRHLDAAADAELSVNPNGFNNIMRERDELDAAHPGAIPKNDFNSNLKHANNVYRAATADSSQAYEDIKHLALGTKQNAVLDHLKEASNSATPHTAAKHLRSALTALGNSNSSAAARVKQALKKMNSAVKASDAVFGEQHKKKKYL